MSILAPKQKLVLLVLLVWPVEAAEERVVPVDPLVGQVEQLVPGPCSLAVVVPVVHAEHIELMLRQCLFVVCWRRGSLLYFFDRPVKKQVVGARVKCVFEFIMILGKLPYVRIIVDVQNALVKVTGSFWLGRMTHHARMMCRDTSTQLDIPSGCQGHLTRLC